MSVRRNAARTPASVTTTISSTAAVFHALKRKRSERNSGLSCSKRIAASSHGLNHRIVESFVQFAAQPVDVHLDHVGRAFPIGFPQVFAEHAARDYLTRVAHQQF